MGTLKETAISAHELSRHLENAVEASGELAENAAEVKQEVAGADVAAQQLRRTAEATSFEAALKGIRAIQRGLSSASGLWGNFIEWRKGPQQFELKMLELNRKLTYAGMGTAMFGKWHDLDFAKMHLNELRKFEISAIASGRTAANVKALEYSMKRFGGTAQEALQWTKKMEISLADMEWGGEGGALGQVAFEYGLDFTGAESQEDIDYKIAQLLDTLPKRQQVRVAQMLGLSDANFARLTDKDASGNLTLQSSQEYGQSQASITASAQRLDDAKKGFEADQLAAIKIEQEQFRFAQENLNKILDNISISADNAYLEMQKKLDDATFSREMEQRRNELEKQFAQEEYNKSRLDLILSAINNIISIITAGWLLVGVIKSLVTSIAGKAAAAAAGAAAGGAAGAAGGATTTGVVAGGATAATAATVAVGVVAPIATSGATAWQSGKIQEYKEGGYDRSKLSPFMQFAIGTSFLDAADKHKEAADKQAAGRHRLASQRVDDAIAAYQNPDNMGAPELLKAWQTQRGYDKRLDATPDQVKKLNDFIAGMSQAEASSLVDEVNWKNRKGQTRGYVIDPSTISILNKRAKGVEVTSADVDTAMQDAGYKLAAANQAASEMVGPTVHNAKKIDSHDSYTFNVKDAAEAESIYEGIRDRKDGVGMTPFLMGADSASAGADVGVAY